MTADWREVADHVFVRRHASLDLNVGLVVGSDSCLVVDTRATHEEARDLVEAVRAVTPRPWTVVNTHAHFDHCFGNAVFRPARIWGHLRCAADLRDTGERQRAAARDHAAGAGRADFATALDEVVIDPPDETFTDQSTVDLGGRGVTLRFLGRGHTDHDIVVEVPDADVLFTGDLVEEGAPPDFGDAFPLDWPGTAAALLPLARGPVVPGHGDVVDSSFVEHQAGQLARAAEHARLAHAAGRTVDESWRELPFPEPAARTALARAFWQLDPPQVSSPRG